jgi:SAM-dependent methyltransferase
VSPDTFTAVSDADFLDETRVLYDTVAESYAAKYTDDLDDHPLLNGMVGEFLARVRGVGSGTVGDLGCGTGRMTVNLANRGVDVFGLDLSPGMIAVARRLYPGLWFEVGTLTALDLGDGALAGALLWWSIVHTPPAHVPTVLGEVHRVLAPGGHALLGFHVGDDETVPMSHSYGHDVHGNGYRLSTDHLVRVAESAGLELVVRVDLAANPEFHRFPQAVLMFRKPAPEPAEPTEPAEPA